MKAVLEFDLDTEQELFECAVEGIVWRQAMQEMDKYLRDKLKHGDYSESYFQATQDARDKLYAILNDENLDLWE
jgi:hypothetical protein